MDYTKEFDFFGNGCIWYKLTKLGVSGNMLNIILAMYINVKSMVKIGNVINKEEYYALLGYGKGSHSHRLYSRFISMIK